MRILFILFLGLIHVQLRAQSIQEWEAVRLLERQFKTEQAIGQYEKLLGISPSNYKLLLRLAELNCMMGNEQTDKLIRSKYYQKASEWADQMYKIDSNLADTWYAKALVLGKLIEEKPVKEKVLLTKSIKEYTERGLAIDPKHAKSMYTLAKWHDEVSSLNPAAKAAMKLIFGGLPQASLSQAIELYQKVNQLDPLFIANNYDLALAYKKNGRSDLAMELLNKQIKLAPKTREDQIIKTKSKELLESLK